MSPADEPPDAATHSLTLDRGLRALRVLADEPEGLTVTALARALDTHRAGVYRLLGPLVEHHLVRRDEDGRLTLGVGLVELASRVRSRLQEVAVPVLRQLADELGCTFALTVRDGEEAVVVAVVVPRSGSLHVTYPVGMRHPVAVAAPGIALLAGAAARPGERPAVGEARERGYSSSSGELLVGSSGVGVWIASPGHEADAAISAVWIDDRDPRTVAVPLQHAGQAIAAALR